MNIQEQIKLAMDENTLDKDTLMSFEVPEWATKDKPFIIYHKPFTLADVSYVEKMSGESKAKSLAHTIIRKALTEEGKKIFTLKDLNFLTNSIRSQTAVDIVNSLNAGEKDVDYSQE